MNVITVVGARPQFIKAAVVSRAIAGDNSINEEIIHTGQHYDENMSDVFFNELDIPRPRYTLHNGGVGHGAMTGRMLEQIEAILLENRPDYVLVYGDTNSTLAGALAASKLHIPVAHVEAGLRSFNFKMPEEQNRILTDRISKLLFCPTQTAVDNLMAEGYSNFDSQILQVGDVMYDAALYYAEKAISPSIENLPASFALATIHRAENTDDPAKFQAIIEDLNALHTHLPVVLPLHPRTRQKLLNAKIDIKFIVCDPLGYLQMIWMLKHTSLVITDSGGLQKEAYFFHKPCITMRDQTEWTELITEGANILRNNLDGPFAGAALHWAGNKFSGKNQLYGDGNTATRIVEALTNQF